MKPYQLIKKHNKKVIKNLIKKGVFIMDKHSTFISENANISSGVIILPNCLILENVTIKKGAIIGPNAFLRQGTIVNENAKVGSFVEIKNSTIGKNTKVPHLSYVGDATIGDNTNIGAGTIFANYNGVTKSKTIVGNDVKIGSKNVLIAPVVIEDNVYTGAGAIIKNNVKSGSLAVLDAKQRDIENWVYKNRDVSIKK